MKRIRLNDILHNVKAKVDSRQTNDNASLNSASVNEYSARNRKQTLIHITSTMGEIQEGLIKEKLA